MKRVKTFLILLLCLLATQSAFADSDIKSATESPKVDNQFRSTIGSNKIDLVLVSQDQVIVIFKSIVSTNASSPGLSLSSKTVLFTKSGKRKLEISDWGYLDDNNKPQSLRFNESYKLKPGEDYNFYMSFKGLIGRENIISIYEDGYNGFYWEGIHLNKYGSYADNDDSPSGSKPSKKEKANDDDNKDEARFIVTSAKENGVDITKQAVNELGTYTVFYYKNNELLMANYSSKKDSQSYGEVYDLTEDVQEETETEYKTETYKFSWHYTNTYDNKSGTCQCQFQKIYKPQGIVSILKMVTESLDVIEYTGYMEGTVDFSNF